MLTKLANHIAKSADCKLGSYLPELAPVCTLLALSAADFDTILQATEVVLSRWRSSSLLVYAERFD